MDDGHPGVGTWGRVSGSSGAALGTTGGVSDHVRGRQVPVVERSAVQELLLGAGVVPTLAEGRRVAAGAREE